MLCNNANRIVFDDIGCSSTTSGNRRCTQSDCSRGKWIQVDFGKKKIHIECNWLDFMIWKNSGDAAVSPISIVQIRNPLLHRCWHVHTCKDEHLCELNILAMYTIFIPAYIFWFTSNWWNTVLCVDHISVVDTNECHRKSANGFATFYRTQRWYFSCSMRDYVIEAVSYYICEHAQYAHQER